MPRLRFLLTFASVLLAGAAFVPSSTGEGWHGSVAFAKGGNSSGNGGNGGRGGGNGKGNGKSGGAGSSAQSRKATGVAPGKSAAAKAARKNAASAKKSAAAKLARSNMTPRPRQSLDRILVGNVSGENLARLVANGFEFAGRSAGNVGRPVTELRVPRGSTIQSALSLAMSVSPALSVATNTYYYPAGHAEECPTCESEHLIGWTETESSCAATPSIGIVDTSLDLKHPSLTTRNIDVIRLSASGSRPDHGTRVAALLVGNHTEHGRGLLPAAKLIAVDAFESEGNSERTDAMSLIRSIEILVERKVDVINLSLTGPPNDLLREAIDAAIAQGIAVVAAVGNDGPGAEPAYPGAYPNVVAVTGVDKDMSILRTANRGEYVDFAAPGVTLMSESGLESGTSFAAPFVSAAIAVLRQNQPQLTPQEAELTLGKSAVDLGAPGRDGVFGWGLVQADGICGPSAVSTRAVPAIATVAE